MRKDRTIAEWVDLADALNRLAQDDTYLALEEWLADRRNMNCGPAAHPDPAYYKTTHRALRDFLAGAWFGYQECILGVDRFADYCRAQAARLKEKADARRADEARQPRGNEYQ